MRESLKKLSLYLTGILVFLIPLKFTVPVVLIHFTNWPESLSRWPSTTVEWMKVQEWIFGFWRNEIFYFLLLPVFVIQLLAYRSQFNKITFKLMVPWLVFLFVQCLSLIQSFDKHVSNVTVMLFFSLSLGYVMGAAFNSEESIRSLLRFWMAACVLIALSGISQANGGLQLMRDYLVVHPELARNDPDFWLKVQTNRIFATFTSPNACGSFFAVSIILVTGLLWNERAMMKRWLYGILLAACFYCLWYTESKGSWLTLAITLAITFYLFRPKYRTSFFIVFLSFIAGLVCFVMMGFGQRIISSGIATWGARIQYWNAAIKIGADYPVLGSGPGTFFHLYAKYKLPSDEFTRLVHNNYLQMWCDSGLFGFASYLVIVPGILIFCCVKLRSTLMHTRSIWIFIWAACLFFAIHSLVDFDLYMISNSWSFFLLLGSLASTAIRKNHQVNS